MSSLWKNKKKGHLCHPSWYYWAPTLEVGVVGQAQPKIGTWVPVGLWIVVWVAFATTDLNQIGFLILL